MKKIGGRNIPREALEYYRFQALTLRRKGWKVEEIAEAFGVHRCSVSHWFIKAKRYGKDILKRTKAKGKEPNLNKKDKKKIFFWLRKSAMNFGFETPLWDCKRIRIMIKRELKKEIAVSNLWGTLRRWNLTPQKPKKEAIEKDSKEVKKWLKEEWPKIRKHVRRWQAMLYFQDESGISLTPVLGRTWAPKGKTPVVKVTGKRGGFCVTSAISPAGRMLFRIEKEKVTAKVHIQFLKQVLMSHPQRKIIVIEDNARPHIAKKVGNFVEENKKRFALYHIPSYSPELNPDEHVWAYLKGHKLKTHQAQTEKELKSLVISKMKGIQRSPALVKSFFIGTYVL